MSLFLKLQRAATATAALAVIAPTALVAAYAFNSAERGMTWQGFSLKWFARCLRDPELRDVLGRSAAVASVVTLAALLLGVSAAFTLSALSPLRRRWALAIVVTVIGCPDLALSIAQADVLRRVGLEPGTLYVALGQVPYATGYVLLATLATAVSVQVERHLLAAEDLGASPLRTLWHVFAPMTRSGWMAGAAMGFALAFQDVVFSAQLAGAGNATLGLRLYGMLRRGVSPEINMVFLITLTLVALIVSALPSTDTEQEVAR